MSEAVSLYHVTLPPGYNGALSLMEMVEGEETDRKGGGRWADAKGRPHTSSTRSTPGRVVRACASFGVTL